MKIGVARPNPASLSYPISQGKQFNAATISNNQKALWDMPKEIGALALADTANLRISSVPIAFLPIVRIFS